MCMCASARLDVCGRFGVGRRLGVWVFGFVCVCVGVWAFRCVWGRLGVGGPLGVWGHLDVCVWAFGCVWACGCVWAFGCVW